MKRPSILLIISAVLVVLLVFVFVFPSAMLSPGPLIAGHAELKHDCFACHAPFRGAPAQQCVSCHATADIGVRTSRGAPVERVEEHAMRASFHTELSEQTCGACHSDHGRQTEHRFSHALLRAAAREECASCHAAPPDDLHRNLPVPCSQCHTVEQWAPATFDHAVLGSATLARCESCHTAPKDTFHGQSATACSQCHTPQRWTPSTFSHDKFFVLDRDHNTTCTTCHINGEFSRYSCFGCHEHTPANIRAEHAEEGIRDIENCVRCHKSADDEGGGRGGGRGRDDDDEDD